MADVVLNLTYNALYNVPSGSTSFNTDLNIPFTWTGLTSAGDPVQNACNFWCALAADGTSLDIPLELYSSGLSNLKLDEAGCAVTGKLSASYNPAPGQPPVAAIVVYSTIQIFLDLDQEADSHSIEPTFSIALQDNNLPQGYMYDFAIDMTLGDSISADDHRLGIIKHVTNFPDSANAEPGTPVDSPPEQGGSLSTRQIKVQVPIQPTNPPSSSGNSYASILLTVYMAFSSSGT